MRKKMTALILALALALSLLPGASAAELARASTQSVEVDGTPVEFQMYALESAEGLTNYVKLRDVAHVLNSTPARFSVGYDGTIGIVTGEAYTDNGSEMATPYSGDRAYQPGPGAVKVNGADVSLDAIVLTDDNGGAYTYFKLRDLGTALGFKVDWTRERGVFIETGAAAETPAQSSAPAAASDLTLADFSGVWRIEYEDNKVQEYIFAGDQYEEVTYDKSGVPSESGYGPYWYESGTVTLSKNIYSSYAGTTFPYVLELHAREKYNGLTYSASSDVFSFSLRGADPAAGYFLDRNGMRWNKAGSSLYLETAKAKVEAHKAGEAAAPKVLTLEDLQGTWHFPGKGDNSAREYIFTGDQLKAIIYTNNESYEYMYYTAACTLVSSNESGTELKMSSVQQYQVSESGAEKSMESPRTSLKIQREQGGRISVSDYGTYTCEHISEPRLDREMMSLIEAAKAKREETESKYPSYGDFPGVPDFGAIYGLSMKEQHVTRGWGSERMTVCTYDYDEAEELACELFGGGDVKYYQRYDMLAKLEDAYYRILEECGYGESLEKNTVGDPLVVHKNDELGYRVDVEITLFGDGGFEIYIQPLK